MTTITPNARYAVKSNDDWYICTAISSSKYDDELGNFLVWSHVTDTGWICRVDEEDQYIKLDQ